MAKTVLITGCSSGIGRETAAAFLEDDWRVWATARDEDDVAEHEADGYRTAGLDVTDARECERVVERVVDTDGRIDCLVNAASYGRFGPLESVSTEELHDQFDVNVYGPHRLVREVLPHMRERADGVIVNVSSLAGRIATPGNGPYCASKFAIEAMSDSLRAEVEDFGVDVVVVEPGPVEEPVEQSNNAAAVQSSEESTEGERERAGRDAELDGGPEFDRKSEYAWLYDLYDDATLVGGGGVLSIPPRAVAFTIRDAASASDPDPRYPVGEFAKLVLLARFLPERWRDVAFRILRKLA